MHKASVDYTQRQLSCLILDEFHLIPVDLETQLSTMRKYGLHCVFANQHMFQIEDKKTRNVTTSASSSLIFRLLPEDAEIAARSFGIPAKELIELEPFEAFFFSGGKIFKVKTPKPEFPEKDYSEEIKRRCLEKYYLKKRNNVTIKKKLKYGEI
jgi:hypothetical protein